MKQFENLSKEISYALRHAPWEYELEMDEEGWVPIGQLLEALHREEKWKNICEADLSKMIEESKKKHHDDKPCILTVDAKGAWNEGIKFYLGNEKVWLADAIPSKYIKG